METNQIKFGNLLKRMRTFRAISQQNLADSLSITRQYLSRIENGNIRAGFNVVARASKFFGISIEALMLLTFEMPPELSESDQKQLEKIKRRLLAVL